MTVMLKWEVGGTGRDLPIVVIVESEKYNASMWSFISNVDCKYNLVRQKHWVTKFEEFPNGKDADLPMSQKAIVLVLPSGFISALLPNQLKAR